MVRKASTLARVGPPIIFLQAQRSCAISSFISIAFMSLLTQLSMFSSEHLCPPHRSHSFLCICSPNRSLSSAQCLQTISTVLSGSCPRHIQCPNDSIFHHYAFYHLTTLHMHILRTIIFSALLNLFRSPAFVAHVLLPYTNTLNTGIIYVSIQFQIDTPFCQNWC